MTLCIVRCEPQGVRKLLDRLLKISTSREGHTQANACTGIRGRHGYNGSQRLHRVGKMTRIDRLVGLHQEIGLALLQILELNKPWVRDYRHGLSLHCKLAQ